jgi:surface protein
LAQLESTEETTSTELEEEETTSDITNEYGVSVLDDEVNIAQGTYGDITWVIDKDGKLTVNGTGECVVDGEALWSEYSYDIMSAEINVTGITNASNLFSYCSMESIDLSGLDTSQVTDMSGMFFYCSNLKSIDLSGLDTSQVTDMSGMFFYCDSLKSIGLSRLDTSQVTNMEAMFWCKSLIELDLSSWDMSKVTNAKEMFYADALNTIYAPLNLNVAIELPYDKSSDIWYLPNGKETRVLPMNRTTSVTICKNKVPESENGDGEDKDIASGK